MTLVRRRLRWIPASLTPLGTIGSMAVLKWPTQLWLGLRKCVQVARCGQTQHPLLPQKRDACQRHSWRQSLPRRARLGEQCLRQSRRMAAKMTPVTKKSQSVQSVWPNSGARLNSWCSLVLGVLAQTWRAAAVGRTHFIQLVLSAGYCSNQGLALLAEATFAAGFQRQDPLRWLVPALVGHRHLRQGLARRRLTIGHGVCRHRGTTHPASVLWLRASAAVGAQP